MPSSPRSVLFLDLFALVLLGPVFEQFLVAVVGLRGALEVEEGIEKVAALHEALWPAAFVFFKALLVG